MGVVGIHIHGLKNSEGKVSKKGKNPFASIRHGKTGKAAVFDRKVLRPDRIEQPRTIRLDQETLGQCCRRSEQNTQE